jgi:hypothetical protein
MPQLNDLSRSLVALDQYSTIIAVVELSQSSWLVAGVLRSLPYLRPFAITGNLGSDFPTKVESAGVPNPNNFNYGFAFEYSLPYLQCCVKDIGLRAPFNQLIPLVEIAFTTPMNRVTPGVGTVGTIQPGVIWAGTYFQIGAEAILPATRLTGHGYGGVVQFHVYLDDLFPHSIGRPISEWW